MYVKKYLFYRLLCKVGDEAQTHPSPGASRRWTLAHRPGERSDSSPGLPPPFSWPRGKAGGVHRGAERYWDPHATPTPWGLSLPLGSAMPAAWMCPPAG